ncbi:TPA: DNA primase, partial [Pasteurella multocida]|nr:DNA primase [Pasteurella multocida]
MSKLINAPHLKEQPKDFMNDLIVLAGGSAWSAWNKGKGEEWLLLCQALQHESKQKPVILGEKQLEIISQIRIAHPEQQYIRLIQFGNLSKEEITALCLNIAKNTKAKVILLCDMLGQTVENLSQYIERLRNDSDTAKSAKMVSKT